MVAGARGQRRQQQRGVHRPVQPRPSAGSTAVGSTPTRPAEVRPVSSTITTRRSRSGRQVRTTTSARRAVARQSIERTSSPTTYSRSESNSVPWPRISTAAPVDLAQLGQPRRQMLAATGTAAGPGPARAPGGDRCRPARPSGPIERAVTASARWSPRRRRGSAGWRRSRSPGGDSDGVARGSALAARRPGVPQHAAEPAAIRRCGRAAPHPPAGRAGPRCRRPAPAAARRALAASPTSTSTSSDQHQQQHPESRCRPGRRAAIGSTHSSATSPVRPVRTTSGAPARTPGCRRARRRGWRPPARPPGRSAIRCRSVGRAMRLDVVGRDVVRPDSHAHDRAVASRAVAPRGETPS